MLPEAAPYWNAFATLSPARPWISTGHGAIPQGLQYEAMRAYAADFGFLEMLPEFLQILGAMDAEYLSHHRPKPAP